MRLKIRAAVLAIALAPIFIPLVTETSFADDTASGEAVTEPPQASDPIKSPTWPPGRRPDPSEERVPRNRESGPEVPFPLSTDMPFPWNEIQGIWAAQSAVGYSALFSFEIQHDDGAQHQVLRVRHFDPCAGRVVAEGIGIFHSDDQIVRAAMSGDSSHYMLFIGAFHDPDSPQDPTSAVMVLTMRSFRAPEDADVQLVMRKISSHVMSER